MTAQPRRRWFRFAFGLRTLFIVVTIFAVWLGWQRHIVQERKTTRIELERRFGAKGFEYLCVETLLAASIPPSDHGYEYARVSFIRRLLGDESCLAIDLPVGDPQLVERVEKSFPEAKIQLFDSDNSIFAIRDSLTKPNGTRVPNFGYAFTTGIKDQP